MLKHLPRPIVVHFIQTLAAPETDLSRAAKAKRRHTWKGDTGGGDSAQPHLPSFSGDHMSREEQISLASAVHRSPSPTASPPLAASNDKGGTEEYVSFA
jgi:hypothetical protein